MMKPSFVHLRVSSEYSISRGLLRINEIIERAVKLKMPAVALTDLNNMFGMVKFFKKAESAGIKPIAGTILNLIPGMVLREKCCVLQKIMQDLKP
jgi:DNA polymerase-3 subunit alpha